MAVLASLPMIVRHGLDRERPMNVPSTFDPYFEFEMRAEDTTIMKYYHGDSARFEEWAFLMGGTRTKKIGLLRKTKLLASA